MPWAAAGQNDVASYITQRFWNLRYKPMPSYATVGWGGLQISMWNVKSRPKSEKCYAWELRKTKIYDTIRCRTSITLQTLAATQDMKSVTQVLRVEYIFLTEKKKHYHHHLHVQIWGYRGCIKIADTWDMRLGSMVDGVDILQGATYFETMEPIYHTARRHIL